jgi:hypothetical protein
MKTTKTNTIWQLHYPSGKRNVVELVLAQRIEDPAGRIHDLGTDKRFDERHLGTVPLDPKGALSLARLLIDFAEGSMRNGG